MTVPNRKLLRILTTQAPITAALVSKDSDGQMRIIWPWLISDSQRADVDNASRPERAFDESHYERVLDERTIRANKGSL